jgi:amidase
MKRVARDQLTFRFAADVPPVLEVQPGETIEMESYDTTMGRVRTPEAVHAYAKIRDPKRVNPAAGPVYVSGAEPGDTLIAEILDIKLDDLGCLRIMPGDMGVLTEEMEKPYCRIVRIEGDRAIFSPEISFPVRPMVGVLATAPAEGEITTAVPGDVGSNMDHADIRVGTKVYLPVHVPGALFGLGDLHAAMGDGEITGNAIEISGLTTVRLDLLKGRRWPRPWLETASHWITTASAPTIEAAIKTGARDMVDFLTEKLGVNREDAYMLISARGDVRIGQSCGGVDATIRVLYPKD